MRLVDTTYAYLAGIIDSDGHITIQKTRKNIKTGTSEWTATYYAARMGIAGTKDAPHRLAVETFGGSLTRHQPRNVGHRLVYYWALSGQKAAAALRLLLPHLLIKRAQAEAAVDLAELIQRQFAETKATQRPPYRITEAMNSEREQLWIAVTALNEPRNRRVHIAPTG